MMKFSYYLTLGFTLTLINHVDFVWATETPPIIGDIFALAVFAVPICVAITVLAVFCGCIVLCCTLAISSGYLNCILNCCESDPDDLPRSTYELSPIKSIPIVSQSPLPLPPSHWDEEADPEWDIFNRLAYPEYWNTMYPLLSSMVS